MRPDFGTITLIGSGEFSEGMARVYRTILAKGPTEPRAVFLDTPAGFELNSDQIAIKASEYFARHLGLDLEIASFKNSKRASALDVEAALGVLLRADLLFAGPGSPTYVVRHWQNSPVWQTILDRFKQGSHLVFASAAAISMGTYTLPVYEIYKAGADLYWSQGLDLFRVLDMRLAVVPHWNNNEGAHDTRYCYMGADRFHELAAMLPQGTTVLGIDEYTACLFDVITQTCRVMGAGAVTVRSSGQELSYASGQSFPFAQLQTAMASTVNRPAPELDNATARESDETTRYLIHLARALDEVSEPDAKRGLIDRAHDTMHELSADWIESAHTTAEQDPTPFVEAFIQIRSQLRDAKEYALADEIRKRLTALGIELRDSSMGTTWFKLTH